MKDKGYAFILVMDEKYWNRIRQRCIDNRETLAFVRKGQVGPTRTMRVIFYVKKPIMQIRGAADFIERLKGEREEMWARYGKESCFESEEEYNSFVQGRERVTFIRFRNLLALDKPTVAEEISMVLGSLRGFHGRYVDIDTSRKLAT